MEVMKTTKLTKYYGKVRGIKELDLTVTHGEFFGFIGPNGAGKSTAIRTVLGLIAPTSGDAMIFGKDVTKEREAILQNIGYLPSEALFYQGMKVKDILRLSADLRKVDCSAESKRLCERLQLDTARKIDDLSFGNRKKVAIVCTLQHRPELLVLDEPTGGLDPLMQKEFFDISPGGPGPGIRAVLPGGQEPFLRRHGTGALHRQARGGLSGCPGGAPQRTGPRQHLYAYLSEGGSMRGACNPGGSVLG